MSRIPNAQLTHFGLNCRDLKAMTAFYQRLLGLVQTDGGEYYAGEIVFLSRNPQEHHQLVLASGRPAEKGYSPINQISFRVDSLDDLKYFHTALQNEKEVEIQRIVTHGNAWSIYFMDPEGNRVELYTPSPWYVAQPFGIPIDLTDSVENLVAHTEALLKDNPTRLPMQEWSDGLKARINQ
ncbi:MAG: VOC family protein [Betaproteobacteria bacterium]|nr:VOC family protein [Betaproteobacteria bacterium]